MWFRGLRSPRRAPTPTTGCAWLVIIGTIPIAVLGVLFKHQIETVAEPVADRDDHGRVGVLLGLAEYYGRQKIELRQLKVSDGVIPVRAGVRADPRGVASGGR